MKKTLFALFAAVAVAAACAKMETPAPVTQTAGADQFTAYFQEPESADATKVILDDDMHLWWNSLGGDPISLFTGNIHSQYVSTYVQNVAGNSAQPNYAVFTKMGNVADIPLGYTLERNYAVYPYDEKNSVSQDGVLSYESHFGYKMAAVTKNADDKVLYFKSLVGILRIPFQGSGVIDKLVFRGNNGEILSGKATAKLVYGQDPEITMGSTGEKELVQEKMQWEMAPTARTFTFCLPPMTFTKGFTVVVTDVAGNEYTFKTDQERTIRRNVYNTMDPIEIHCAMYAPYTSVEAAQEDLDQAYVDLARPNLFYSQPDDFGFLMNMFSNDAEGADLILPNSGYNWFSVSSSYERRDTYRNLIIRVREPMSMVEKATRIIAGLSGMNSAKAKYIEGQARALRAYAYLTLADNLSFGPAYDPLAPCAPILDESVEDISTITTNTVREVYDFIQYDLTIAESFLQGFTRSSAAQIDGNVVSGLLARTHLARQDWAVARDYAARVALAFSPASMAEVSVPSFKDISEHNWVWGYDMTEEVAGGSYATTSSWLRSFSAQAYSAACQCYAAINQLLYDQIPDTDVRKGWWVNENLESPLLDGLTWPGLEDASVAYADDGGVAKTMYLPYTNVKFGCNAVGTTLNDEDMPIMRVEEMLLIQAECAARMGDINTARNTLESFVRSYRDPQYDVNAGGRALLDEIWYQRRVELWGEGFGRTDLVRLGKPMVRFVPNKPSNVPYYYCFNLEPYDQHFILPVGTMVQQIYPGFLPNYSSLDGPAPESGASLRDGVTD